MAKKEKPPKPEKPAKAGKAPAKGGGGVKKVKTNFLLEKGELLVAAAGAAGLVVLLATGVSALTSAADPVALAKALESKAAEITKKVADDSPPNPAPVLPDWVTKPPAFPGVRAPEYALIGVPFEPVITPDLLRDNPRVYGITDGQVRLVLGPMRSNDIQVDANSQGGDSVKIGVLVTYKNKVLTPRQMTETFRDVFRQPVNPRGVRRPRPAPGAPPPGTPVQPAGFVPPTRGDNIPQGPNGFSSQFGAPPREDKSVQYLTPEEVETSGAPWAETVKPLRAALVYAVVPVKAQAEEFKRALKLTAAQALGDAPVPGPGRMAGGGCRPGRPRPPGLTPGPGRCTTGSRSSGG